MVDFKQVMTLYIVRQITLTMFTNPTFFSTCGLLNLLGLGSDVDRR